MTFTDLQLAAPILKALSETGYTQPTPIQEQAIPHVLKQRDILGCAQTGTGKTAAFACPIIHLLDARPAAEKRNVRTLILTPTRELAIQIGESFAEYGQYTSIKHTVIFGGVNQSPQVTTLRQGVDILIATPGRLLDLHNQRLVSLATIEILVLDEADRMLDMGFLRDIKKIMALMPTKRQNLLFSATFSKDIKALANEILNHPVLVEATPENTTVEKIDQKVYHVDKGQKPNLLVKLISEGKWEQVLVFTRTKHGANKLTKKLISSNISALAIHGNKSQGARTSALKGFKDGSIRVLVATDIAARGLDIPLLPHVINFELPNIPEDYVHRIGRTGRAGASGEAISLVSSDEKTYLRDIEKLVGLRIPSSVIEGFMPDPNAPEEADDRPARQQRPQRNQQQTSNKPAGANRNRNNNRRRPNNRNNERRTE
jgi:ATP-dependent RNA helicase RhlE